MVFYEFGYGLSIVELFLLINIPMTVVCALFYYKTLRTAEGIRGYIVYAFIKYAPVLMALALLFVIVGLLYWAQHYIEPLSFLSIGRGFEWAFYWNLSIAFVMLSWNLLLICFFVDLVERFK